MGESSVLVGYLPAARIGDPPACGGTIAIGCPTVIVGSSAQSLQSLSGPSRAATRKEDQAALESLAKRGITKKERDRLSALVDAAHSVDAPNAILPSAGPGERAAALSALHAWYKDWSDTAHSVITKRAYLITLGLAKRRASKKDEEEALDEPADAAAPPKDVAAPAKSVSTPVK